MEYLGMKMYYIAHRGDLGPQSFILRETRMLTVDRPVLLYLSGSVLLVEMNESAAFAGHKREREPARMDMKVLIMMGCVLCTTSGLCFMELRRIRKNLGA